MRKRIIPCLDTKGGRVVKGVNFKGLADIDSPLRLARKYSDEGADELALYDIASSLEGRLIFTDLVRNVAAVISIPLIVGGGLRTLADCQIILDSGADKLSINSGALADRNLIHQAANRFGSERIVLSADVKIVAGEYHIFSQGGSVDTGLSALAWIKNCAADGAGELILNSIDTDGVRSGYDIEMLKAITDAVDIPVVASGGAGSIQDIIDVFEKVPRVSAALAASIFHYETVKLTDLKKALAEHGY